MRFDLAQLLRPNQPKSCEPVRLATLAQILQARQFLFLRCYNDLTAYVVRDSVLTAELDHRGGARNTEACFQGARLVVHAGVNDSAVVSALVSRDAILFLQHQKPLPREAPRNLQGDSEANDSCADDDDVEARISHATGTLGATKAQACS
jgi:hypothetical protein